MVLMSIRLGTNDIARATAFYDATFAAIGLKDIRLAGDGSRATYPLPGGVWFMIGAPLNGEAATHGNGDTIGFNAPDVAAVEQWHAAALAQGGSCEGAPGPRELAGGRFGAYIRDPDGHKLCAYAEG